MTSILETAQGAIMERVNYEMEKVLTNILDANTSPTAKRKIQLTLILKPTNDRQVITMSTVVKSTLAPTEPIETSLFVTGKRSTGELTLTENMTEVPGQMDMSGEEQMPGKIVNIG